MVASVPWRALALAWWGLTWWFLFKPASGEPPPFEHYDKLGHFLLFFVQGLLLVPAWRARVWRLMLALALWAVLSELSQGAFTADRMADPFDALADMAGGACALALWWAVLGRSGKLLSLIGR